jgi:hypothetical protein
VPPNSIAGSVFGNTTPSKTGMEPILKTFNYERVVLSRNLWKFLDSRGKVFILEKEMKLIPTKNQ